MVFSSVTFLFFFLPITLLIYTVAGKKLRNYVLLAASLIFYSWGEGIYLLVMLVSILINYICGCLIIKTETDSPSKSLLALGICLNLVILSFFKYANFFTDNINILLTAVKIPTIHLSPVHLPIGISFFTFQAMSYLVDVYRKKTKPQRSLINLSLYIALFPQLIAGPIVRYHDIAKQLVQRKMSVPEFSYGIQRFFFGLSKKVLLANPMAAVADQVFSLPTTELSLPVAWFGALCYTFQIYFDFSGYSDMAIGLGRLFGFNFPENFNYPYISKTFREFWRRWHISLSSWLRDYLYIPLGGSRCSNTRTTFNLITVFLLCGLWHGASWTFVIWGTYHGFFITLERTVWFGKYRENLWQPLQRLLTFLLVLIGWVIFRSDTITGAGQYLSIMFNFSSLPVSLEQLQAMVDSKIIFETTIATLLSFPLYPALSYALDFPGNLSSRFQIYYAAGSYLIRLSFFCTLIYFTVITLAAEVYNPFIYFRF